MSIEIPSINLADIEKARERIAPYIRRTPTLPFDYLNLAKGKNVWLKAELLQLTGSFKIRGAANCVLSNLAQAKKSGVVAASAGNHAQGVASICRFLGIPATIVMPVGTPGIKIQNTENWGAKVELVGEVYDESYEHAQKLAQDQKLLFVHPFRDPLIQAGQGTIGLELLEEPFFKDIEAVIVPIGGGGLITGVGTVLKKLAPKVKIYGVTAQNAPAAYHALTSGKPATEPVQFTLAEGTATKKTEADMLTRIRPNVDEVLSIKEESIAHAISVLAEQSKLVVEGSAALSVAPLLDGQIKEKNVVSLLSGGNIDLPALSNVLQRGLVEQGRLVRLVIRITDRPGGLAALTQVLAEKRANILQIAHQRATMHTRVGEAIVDVDIETRGPKHTEEVISALTARGFSVTNEN